VQAIIDAHNDPQYTKIRDNVKAIIFLGTPHRGSNFAPYLSKLLHVSFAGKEFVDDLHPKSTMIRNINENFRHRTETLELVSFFESKGMQGIGVRSSSFFSNMHHLDYC
jgi:hypothetical protein